VIEHSAGIGFARELADLSPVTTQNSSMPRSVLLLAFALAARLSSSWSLASSRRIASPRSLALARASILSPFDPVLSGASARGSPAQQGARVDGPLELTLDNVEIVLEEIRPFLMSDGGNVAVTEIDGDIVRLELQGACGTCPSSTMTMKMGLEKRLKEGELRDHNSILRGDAHDRVGRVCTSLLIGAMAAS